MRFRTAAVLQTAGLVIGLGICGCRVESNKQGTGDDVRIATPFGGMHVKTDDSVAAEGVGIPVYPGAVPITKNEKGKDDGAADVNMSFGAFQMRVKALSYRSDDSADKIATFYRDALKRYGDVIQCEHDNPVGTPTQTSQGLTCDNKKSNHMTVTGSGSGKMEIKAGSQQHQHIVALDREGSGTKIGLVALDLPGHLSFGDNEDGDKQ
jgi:hypothetical protein